MEYSYSKEPKPQDIFYFFRNLNPVGKFFLGLCSFIFISLLFGGVYLYFFAGTDSQGPYVILKEIGSQISDVGRRPIPVETVSITQVASISAQKAKESTESASYQDIQEPQEEEKVLILDLRSREEYKQGHVPGALSLPKEILFEGAFYLPENSVAVIYDSQDVSSELDKITKKLQTAGVTEVRVLDGGYANWGRSGGTVEEGDSYSEF